MLLNYVVRLIYEDCVENGWIMLILVNYVDIGELCWWWWIMLLVTPGGITVSGDSHSRPLGQYWWCVDVFVVIHVVVVVDYVESSIAWHASFALCWDELGVSHVGCLVCRAPVESMLRWFMWLGWRVTQLIRISTGIRFMSNAMNIPP